MILLPSDLELSRRDTEHGFHRYAWSLGFEAVPGRRSWVHRAMRLRVVERRVDRDLAAEIVKRRHYLASWPARPKTLVYTVLASLDGVVENPSTGAAGLVMITLQPAQYHVTRTLGLAQYEVLTLSRTWRASDLTPDLAPDFTPELLRRVVRGERGRGPLRDLRTEWTARKCRADGLRASPRLLATYADPAVGHDGALYLAAGATACGPGAGGKLLFAWALDEELREPLRQLGRAAAERRSVPARAGRAA